MEELMKIMLENAQQQGRQPKRQTSQSDILMEILQGAMSGRQPTQARKTPQSQNMLNIADILGAVLGGGQQASPSQAQMNPMVASIANALAQKLGISPSVAQVIISFAMAALLKRGQPAPAGSAKRSRQAEQTYDLDDLLEGDFAWESGMAQQISAKTGLSEDEAAYNLQEAMMMLSGNPMFARQSKKRRPKTASSPNQLDHLLDSWEVDG